MAVPGTSKALGDLVIVNADNVNVNGNNITARDFYQKAGQGTTNNQRHPDHHLQHAKPDLHTDRGHHPDLVPRP